MKSAAMGGRTGTHDTLWTWQQLLTLRHSAMGPCTASSCCCQARNLPAPYHKMEPTNSVRRPESGT
ncbi:unnamed protein product, partial [Staurois parvus]